MGKRDLYITIEKLPKVPEKSSTNKSENLRIPKNSEVKPEIKKIKNRMAPYSCI